MVGNRLDLCIPRTAHHTYGKRKKTSPACAHCDNRGSVGDLFYDRIRFSAGMKENDEGCLK